MLKLLWLLLIAPCFAQTTPYLNLKVSPTKALNWGPHINSNYSTFDSLLRGVSNKSITSVQLNNVCYVDGTVNLQTAAGINSCDAKLIPGNPGEIVVPSGTIVATDAQISVGNAHVLRVIGTLLIDAVNRGPILLGKYSRLTCSQSGGGSNGVGNIQESSPGGTAPSMVQAAVQDGSLETFYVDNCHIYGNGLTITNGMIDGSGMNDKGWIRDNIVRSYVAGFGVFFQDIHTGLAAGSSNTQISGNWFQPGAGAGGCIKFTHGSTNSTILQQFDIINNECQLSGSTLIGAPVVFVNASASGGNLRTMYVADLFIQGVQTGQPNITINGLNGGTFKHVICATSNPCINLPNNTNNQSLDFQDIEEYTRGNNLVDANNSVTITNPTIYYYPYINTSARSQSIATYLNIFRGYGSNTFSIGSDTGFTRMDAGGATGWLFRPFNASNVSTGFSATGLMSTGTVPGLSGTGACATQSTQVGGATTGSFVCTGTTGASTITITPVSPAAHGWVCFAQDFTHPLLGVPSGSVGTTSCAVSFTSVTANDVIQFQANAY